MKSIVCINNQIPTVAEQLSYDSGGSLRDYDIIIFDPVLPYYERINFSGGGSCLTIESSERFSRSSSHWHREISGAIAAGKTVFVILNKIEEDQATTGYTTPTKGSRNYNTFKVNNYSAIPYDLRIRNSNGRFVVVKDNNYKNLHDTIKDIIEYRVVFDHPPSVKSVFSAKDGTVIGGVVKFDKAPGSLVFLPYFSFDDDKFVDDGDDGAEIWNKQALKLSHALVAQLVSIDRLLRGSGELTSPPGWVDKYAKPKAVEEIDGLIAEVQARLDELKRQRDEHVARKADILEYTHLLYESGKPLERAIEKVLRLLDYSVETLRIGDLEIDHVIVGPAGIRMIGEAEGKDTSAIDISKFRQLESNIGEDFERDEVDEPAKGLLFGNGFRLSDPAGRAEQFTQKSLTNAKRLGSALIRTADLYPVAVHLLDHPEDESFRSACRAAIEGSAGGVVSFPKP